jgi:hypothetical protein
MGNWYQNGVGGEDYGTDDKMPAREGANISKVMVYA